MKVVNMHEAKSQLSRLARLAWEGEEVVICRAGRPWLRLTPFREQLPRREPGGLEGRVRLGPDFDAEDDDIVAASEDSVLYPIGD